jgi:hypothetical protein
MNRTNAAWEDPEPIGSGSLRLMTSVIIASVIFSPRVWLCFGESPRFSLSVAWVFQQVE